MKPYAVTIPSGSVEEFAVVGDYIRLKTASVPVTFIIEETGESIELEQGDAANLSAFKRVKVLHASGAQQAIVFYVGNGTSSDSSKIGGSVALSSAAGFSQLGVSVTTASAQILAAKIARRFLMVQNNDAGATIYLNLAGNAAAVTGGVKLLPGESLVFDVITPAAAIFAIASVDTAAGAVTVCEA